MSNLEMYAEQCAQERLNRQLTSDVLLLAEFEDDEDIEEILKAVKS